MTTPTMHGGQQTAHNDDPDRTVHVTRIDQIAIAVADLDAALAFYAEAFGLTPRSRQRLEAHGVEEAMIDVGGVALQLVQPLGPDSHLARFLKRHGPGLHHLGFGVASIDDALEHLRQVDVDVVDETPQPGGDGNLVAFVHPRATDGVLIELVEDNPAGDAPPTATERT